MTQEPNTPPVPPKPIVPEGFPEIDAINPNMHPDELTALLKKLEGYDVTLNAEEAAERAMMKQQAEQALAELRAKNLKTNLHVGGGLLAGTAGLLGGIYGGKKLWEHYHQPKPMPPVPQEPDTEHTETRPMPEPAKQADDLTGITLPPRAENTINSLESLLVDQPPVAPDVPSSLAGYDLDFIPNTHERDALVQQLMEPEMKQANWMGDIGRRIGGASPEFIENRNFISELGSKIKEDRMLEQHARRLGVINDVPPAPPERSFAQKYKMPLIGAGVLGGAYLANQHGMFDSPRQQGDQYMQPKFSHDKGYADMLARLGLYKGAAPVPPPKAIAASFKKAPELAKKTPPPVPAKAKKDFNDVQRTMGFSKNSAEAIKEAAFNAGYYDALSALSIKVAARIKPPIKRVATSANDAMRGSAMSAASSNLGRTPGMGSGAAAAPAAPPKPAPAAPKKRTPKTTAPADQPMIPPTAPKIGPNPNQTTVPLNQRKPAIHERNVQKQEALNAADPSRATRGFQSTTLNAPPAAVKPPPAAAPGAVGAAGGPISQPPRTKRPSKAPDAPPTPPPNVAPVGSAAGAPTPPPAAPGATPPPAGPGFGQQIKDTWGKMPGWGKGLSIGGAAGLGGMGIGAAMQPDVNVYR